MDINEFGRVVDVGRYQGAVGRQDFINTYGAKGPIVLLEGREPVAVWTDRKTPGYPNEGLVGKLVFGGGNWRDRREVTPLDTYRREQAEELAIDVAAAGGVVVPFADYFTAVPGEVLKNPRLPHAFYCDLTSIFATELPLEGVYDHLKVPREGRGLSALRDRLAGLAAEASQELTPVQALRDGSHTQFGFGDDHKVANVMNELYGIETSLNLVPGVEVVRLPSQPTDTFESRREVIIAYIRHDNNPFLEKNIGDERVFEARR